MDFNNNTPVAQNNSVMAVSEQSKAIAEIQASLLIAKQFPRNEIQAIEKIKNSCQRKKLAERAIYSYGRGGSNVEGASIRLAEVIASNFGNIDYGFRVLEADNEKSLVEAYAWDKETNTKRVMAFEVPHYRDIKGGKKKLTSDRDIYEVIANMASRRMRACILAIVPFDVIDEAMEVCKQTIRANVDLSSERIQAMVSKFAEYGVSKEMLEKRIQRKISAIEPAQFLNLANIANSLRDGVGVVEDYFEKEDSLDLNAEKEVKPKAKKEAKKEPVQSLQEPLEAEQSKQKFEMIFCPKTEDEVYSSACVNCAAREGCPSHQ